MDIKCERCGTEYEFDDDRVTEDGVTVKCSSCGHLFKVRKKSFVLTEPVPQQGQESDIVEKNWMVRKPDGTMLSFKELTTLQKWIVERKVTRDDEISKSGETWKRLGSIAELSSFFQVVDQANAVSQVPAPQAPVALAAMPTQGMPPASAPAMQALGVGQEPDSWGDGEYEPRGDDVVEKWKKRGRRKWFVVVPLLLILVGLGVLYVSAPEKLQGIVDDLLGPKDEKTERTGATSGKQPQNSDLTPDGAGLADGPRVDAGVVSAPADPGAKPDAGSSGGGADETLVTDAGIAKLADKIKSDSGHGTGEPAAMNYDSLMAKANSLQRSGRSGKALKAYEKALALRPEDVEAITGKGLCLLDMGSNSSAIFSFRKALKINSRYGDAIIGTAEAYKYKKDTANAIKFYKRYLEVLPDGPEAVVAKSNLEQLK